MLWDITAGRLCQSYVRLIPWYLKCWDTQMKSEKCNPSMCLVFHHVFCFNSVKWLSLWLLDTPCVHSNQMRGRETFKLSPWSLLNKTKWIFKFQPMSLILFKYILSKSGMLSYKCNRTLLESTARDCYCKPCPSSPLVFLRFLSICRHRRFSLASREGEGSFSEP